MKKCSFILCAILLLFVGNICTWANPSSSEESISVESEILMITLSNIYHSTGHVDAVATVTNKNEEYPSGNYTYEWSVTPGGTGTTCYVSPDTGQRVNVGGNSSNPNSSRVEIKCIVYQNGSVYDILYNYLYFY